MSRNVCAVRMQNVRPFVVAVFLAPILLVSAAALDESDLQSQFAEVQGKTKERVTVQRGLMGQIKDLFHGTFSKHTLSREYSAAEIENLESRGLSAKSGDSVFFVDNGNLFARRNGESKTEFTGAWSIIKVLAHKSQLITLDQYGTVGLKEKSWRRLGSADELAVAGDELLALYRGGLYVYSGGPAATTSSTSLAPARMPGTVGPSVGGMRAMPGGDDERSAFSSLGIDGVLELQEAHDPVVRFKDGRTVRFSSIRRRP